jgi:hypothetical protein
VAVLWPVFLDDRYRYNAIYELVKRCHSVLTNLLKTRDNYLLLLMTVKMENKVESRLLLNVIIKKCAAVHQLLFEDKTLLVN